MPLRANAPTFVSKTRRRSRNRSRSRSLKASAPAFVPSWLKKTARSSQKVASNTYNALWKEIKNLTVGK